MKSAIVVGAGLAGLTCARRLVELDWQVLVLEASDAPGGRVRTDRVDDFQLDRGFQVLLTAYPAARRWLDYGALQLRFFPAGAEVVTEGGWQRVADPRREFGSILRSLTADIGTMRDKLRVLQWAWESRTSKGELDESLPEQSSEAALRAKGFSDRMIERFWRPWLAGIFLESKLATSSRMLEFVFAQFARGGTALPQDGMQSIPAQLATGLPSGSLRLNHPVVAASAHSVTLENGDTQEADAVIVAVESGAASRLGLPEPDLTWRESRCLYFADAEPATTDGMLRLNGRGDGVVNHFVTLSKVNPSVAPAGQHLMMAGIRPGLSGSTSELESAARKQLMLWFGKQVEGWRLLRDDHVEKALPGRLPLRHVSPRPTDKGIWQTGDYLADASIQGAMTSGERVAEALAKQGNR